jgi:integration host factor subunit beta
VGEDLSENNITKSEMIDRIYEAQARSQGAALTSRDIELAVKIVIEHMTQSLASGKRVEIRGFGSFSLRYRAPRLGRNPKTGESVGLVSKYVPHFKPGKILRDKVNNSSRD